MFYVQVALLGVIVGCVYALSATGIVLTYSATGVFNIAHFAIGLLAGYGQLLAELEMAIGRELPSTPDILAEAS